MSLDPNTYYLLLMCFTLFGPLILSFDKKVHFWTHIKQVLISATLVATPFLIWDIIFTWKEVWGFNGDYLTGINLVNLPIEEVLFFWVVPYAGLFVFECIKQYFPNISNIKKIHFLWYGVAILGIVTLLLNYNKAYTALVMACLLISLTHAIVAKPKWGTYFLLFYGVMLSPFLLVNGVLTGSGLDEPIVWYNSDHILNIRLATIPIEDFLYNFSLLYWNVVLYEYFNQLEIRKLR